VNKQRSNSGLVLLLLAVLLAASLKQKETEPAAADPSPAGLSVILEAFAWNLEHDGQADRPVLEYSNQVGQAINEFGRRSTLGRAYREAFAAEFDELGRDLAAALGSSDGPQRLTPETRAAAVSVLRRHSRTIQ